MTDITRLTQEMKAAAEKAKHAGEAPVMPFDTRISTLNEYQLTVCPDNVLALVEALELKEEQRANWFQMAQKLGEDLDAAEKRNAELEREHENLRPVGVMSEKAYHRLENRESRYIALWPRPEIYLPRKRPEDGVIVYARTTVAAAAREAD
ncbi:TPA: ead/Ea22-like family protein [Klebsiella oxytoca]|nr:ead/Ea22-like family protein [Klebsiella oxytoca]HDX8807462.1 ead/Ea22-like family protein [Klebsiella oxytoca]HDX8994788.1 ead/Ea22-like family protein [Klebsiella oxytoca]HDY4039996.1 ead/Ea22-like family protein [Klebsiella oxytoca]